ncbi:MAG TPA: DUF5719 family protein [Acidimicrobiales bacterium]|nr:DUF5719 family protein [Acidimicrobiales bacterium]
MAEPRRFLVASAVTCLALAGALIGKPGMANPQMAPGQLGGSLPTTVSVSSQALSSSWFCAGATQYPGGVAGGELLFTNAGSRTVSGSVELVTQRGSRRTVAITVPPASATTLPESLPGLPGSPSDHWVGAIVVLYGGMASVSQVLGTARGSADQPCASAAAHQWFFPDGATLRNAWDEISLLNPYPVPAVADLSFTTEQGREVPLDFQGLVVPPRGLTVVDLGSHLRRRQHIATTVTARTGQIVAFQTQIVTAPPAGAPPRGTPGALNPVMPVAGVTVALGSPRTSTSLWWPSGGEGPGMTESYAVYNPGAGSASLSLELFSAGAHSTHSFVVGPYGSAFVTTNDASWALLGEGYSARLESLDGVGVVAERFVMSAPPSLGRGLGLIEGQQAAANEWLLAQGATGLSLTGRERTVFPESQLQVLNPGPATTTVSVEAATGGRLAPLTGATKLQIAAGARAEVELSSGLSGEALLVTSSSPVLLEQDWYSSLRSVGTNLAPAVAVTSP